MALLAVVVLGVPQFASAGQPSVSAPNGAGKTLYNGTYYFTGPYTFDTYISCSGGAQFNSSYSNFLAGTNVFSFYGAPDGSLLVTINGGGKQMVTSCGNPFATPATLVATYSVAVGTPPSPPTPTPTPTPTPPPSGGPHGSTHSGGGTYTYSSTPYTSPPASPPPSPGPTPTATPSPSASPTPSAPRQPSFGDIGPAGPDSQSPLPDPRLVALAWRAGGILLAALVLLLWALWRSRRLRERLRGYFSTPRLRLEARWFNFRQRVRRLLKAIVRALTPKVHGRDLPKRPGLSAHHHSGRVLARHHTSYAALMFLLLLAAILAAAAGLISHADSTLSLTVLGPPPATGATIDSPTDGQHFSTNSVTVQGTCPAGLLVEIYRNGTFAGSALCDSSGLYSVLITLVPGQNDLVARDVDGLGQYGPDSAIVTIYYDAPPPPTPTPTPSPTATPGPAPGKTPPPAVTPRPTAPPAPTGTGTLLITTGQHLYQGSDASTPVQWTVTVSGGHTPYRMTWEWGDGSSDSSPADGAGQLSRSHTYDKPGVYQVTIRATDDAGSEAVIQVVTIINGAGTIQTFGRATPTDQSGNLVLIWPLLIITGLIVLSLWLGERHERVVDTPLFLPAR